MVALAFLVGPTVGGAGPVSVSALKQEVVANELIVGFNPVVTLGQQSAAVRQAGATPDKHFRQIDAVAVRVAAGALERVTKLLASDPRVRYVEPNYVVTTAATPNDPRFGELWGLNNSGQTGGTPDADIDAPAAWDVETGSSSVVVGVTDTGVDFSHPDLAAQQWVNTGENCGSSDPTIVCADRTDGVDDDVNGRIDDWRGWDFVNGDNNPFDDNNHGTHVAGTIGAVGNNGIGVTGVNWNVKIMALKFLDAAGNGSTTDAITATLYAANEGAHISNNSWGGGPFSQALLDAIEYGASQGMLFVAAAGNFTTNTDVSPHYPSSYGSDVIAAVAATDHNDNLSSFSNFGATTVDLGAPGSNILSTIPGSAYAAFNGTSMATPHVAGAAALLKAHFPTATAYGIKALLMRSVDPKASLSGKTVTGGRLNLGSAVSCANAPKVVLLTPLSGFNVTVGQPFPIRVLGANCASPAGIGNVSVTVNGTPVTMTPASPDSARYTGTFTPSAGGTLTVTATVTIASQSDTQTATGTASVNQNYTCQDISDPWVDATGGTQLPLKVDDGFTTITLPFSFTFFGQTHTQAFVSSNGFLTLGSSSGAVTPNNPVIPSTSTPNGVIAPFWDDLNPGVGGAVYSGVTGSSPNRALHLEWFNVPHFTNVGAATLEVSLYETTNEIRFRYLDTDFGNATYNAGRSATAGVENQAGTLGTQYSRNQAVLTNGKTIRCSQGGPPPPPPALTITTTSLPGGSVNQAYSQPVTATGGTTPYSWSVVSGTLPPGLSLSPTGTPSATLSGTPTTAGTYNFTVEVTDSAGPAATDTQALSITVSPAPPLTITTTSLPGGTANQAYSQSVSATGGTTPYSWTVSAGTLPPGLSLSAAGTPSATLSGTPTAAGTFNFTVQVTDSAGPAATDTQDLSITISEASSGIAFGSAGAAAAALGTSINVPYPSGIAANDILLLLVMTRDNVDINTPAGFTQGAARNQGGGIRAEWFWKRATGSESGTLNVTKVSGTTLLLGRMYRYTGAVTSGNPYEAAAQGGLGNNATITPVDITTLGSNRRVLVLVAEADDQALGAFAGGTAGVPEETAEATTALGTDGAVGINGLARTSAETFDFGTYTLGVAAGHVEFTLALVP